jgi:nitrate/TMAO reductase-like tetraheme cytochrome c subunit
MSKKEKILKELTEVINGNSMENDCDTPDYILAEILEKTKDRNASDPIAIKCFECADEHRQLAEWLKELKAHREAWVKVLDEMMNVSIPGQDAEYVYQNIYDIIKKYRPKEGDTK